LPVEMARMGLRAPVNVTWEVTRKCNLRSAHCLLDAGPESAEELSTAECRRLINNLAALAPSCRNPRLIAFNRII